MKNKKQKIIDRIFNAQDENGLWKIIPESHKYHPQYLHYVPNFKATLWIMVLLADLEHDQNDPRIQPALSVLRKQFFDKEHGIYSLKEDHFPIPCLNGNMIYLDAYFNSEIDNRSKSALNFFVQNQRFDDGVYIGEKNEYCSNKSCYGKHSCYWGITKLMKGISFIPLDQRTKDVSELLQKCIDFVLLHHVCFSSRNKDKIMIQKMDLLTFPNMYKSDFLEILWLLKREGIQSNKIQSAIDLLISKQNEDATWNLERKVNNLITSIGPLDKPNQFITQRANEVLGYFNN